MEFDRDLAVMRFREYLRIKTVHPDPDYDTAVKFLVKYGHELQLETKCVNVTESRTAVFMKLPGKDPSLPSILLNSHIDVVPVFPDKWTHDPWAAEMTDDGKIYGRGTQDMKSVGMQYMEALRVLKKKYGSFDRTVYILFVPDEEIGGYNGMKVFMGTPEFKEMNVGLALDEGLASPKNKYSLFYGERSLWWVRVKCPGSPGHGSRFIEDTAAEKLQHVMDSFLSFRKSEEKRLNANPCLHLGDVTTLNLTILEGGVQPNVVPQEFFATFDIRIAPSVNLVEFEKKLHTWCKEAGDDVSFEFLQKKSGECLTEANDNKPWWVAMNRVLKNRGVEVVKEIFSAGTDGRYLRMAGYPVIGFSPMRNTPILLHDNDEFLSRDVFLEGIEVYCELIPAIANLKF